MILFLINDLDLHDRLVVELAKSFDGADDVVFVDFIW